MMKKTLLSSFLMLLISISYSQNPMGGGGQQMNGRFYGKIVDSITGKPIDAASIQLIQNKFDTATKKRTDVNITGMLTSSNGDFSLENVPLFGQYKLKITAIGFEPFEKAIKFDIKMPDRNSGAAPDMSALLNMADKDLGNISLKINSGLLDNVTVSSGGKPLLQLAIDRKIYNVEKDISATGGTAVDVMKNVPSVSVDLDGNVSMRNAAPQIFVDGRPTTMQLDQIPADAIESVEIITNPSAKYDASGGTAGILNIVLKKTKKIGYNGGIRINADSRGRVGGGADINVRQNKLNFFASVNYFPRKSISTGTTDRLTKIGTPNTFLHQSDKNTTIGTFAFARGGFDYFMDNRNTLSISGSYGGGKFTPETISDLYTDSLFTTPISTYSQRISNSNSIFKFRGVQGSFKHNFPKAGREWTADVTYNKRTGDNNNIIQTDYYNAAQSQVDRFSRQQQIGGNSGDFLVVQTDFVNPINDKSKFEIGVRGAYNNNDSYNNFFLYNPSNQQFEKSALLSSQFLSKSTILAAYTTYTKQIKNFGYQAGLRLESSTFTGDLPDKNQQFEINFPISLFPSLFLSQKLKNDQELQLNYSRRINRPNFWQLFPFTDYSDSLNLSRGNPELNPEFTNSIELAYQKIFKNKDNFLASLYFKNTNNLITRSQEKETNPVNSKEELINTYINANNGYTTGLELTLKNKLSKWWEITSNLNLFTSKIDVNIPNAVKQDQYFSYFGKLNNTFKLPKNFTVQLSGEYQSKATLPPSSGGGYGRGFGGTTTSAQGFTRDNYYVDAAVKFDFLKNKAASLSLNVNDIFRTRRNWSYSASEFFEQDTFRRRDPQIFRLNFSWRFGKFDPNLFKRKNMKGERESMQNMNDSGM